MNALVTGGNRGIGLELCRILSEQYGFKVYMACRDKIKAESTIANKRLKNVLPLEIDVSRENSIRMAADKFNDSLFLLINNAGAQLDWIPDVSHIKSLEADENLLSSIYRTNVFASVFMCKYFLPFMVRGGRVVNVASGSGEFWDHNANLDFQIGYAPSKSALIMTSKKLAAAAREFGVVVNSCCPGWCRTSMGGEGATTSAKDGAMSVIKACFLDMENPPSGGHWRYGSRIPIESIPYNIIGASKKIYLKQLNNIYKFFVFSLFSKSYRMIFFIHNTGLFDSLFYRCKYQDIVNINPIEHYVKYGAYEGRDPNAWFSTSKYYDNNPDVKECGINAFYHYLRYGIKEGRFI